MIGDVQTLGRTIESHTLSHANLKGISSSELRKEIIQSKEEIEIATGNICNYFAFPFGDKNYFDKNSIDLVNLTYDYSFTSGLYSNYFFVEYKQILSRRHFECNWPLRHIKYFTSGKRI
jgi:peptidoglycan/xylan/chitin deacetylase (PgdA/CDA1 family)